MSEHDHWPQAAPPERREAARGVSASDDGEPSAPRILDAMSWRSFTVPKGSLIWLVYLATLLFQPLFDPGSDWVDWVLVGLIVLVFLPIYGWIQRHGCDRPYFWRRQPGGLLAIGILLALGVLLAPLNAGTSTFFIYAGGAAAIMRPRRLAVSGIIASFVLVPVAALVSGMGFPLVIYPYLPALIFVPVIGATNYYQREREDSNARLRMAQDEVERLATIAERERIARDLHDLLGHTLSTITLKAELAARLMEADPVKAAKEVRDVERISRDALSQVREAVRGYKSSGLDGELANAKLALEAAGLRFDYYFEPLDVPPIAESALALALREGVTNVVRHAGAERCQVRIEAHGATAVLSVTDDGPRHGSSSPNGDDQTGSGLRGMRSRIEALGGTVNLRHQAQSTVLEVRLPLDEPGLSAPLRAPTEATSAA